MKKINTIFVLGILTALFPFLGFPGFVKTGVVLIFGIAISIISGIMIIDYKARSQSLLSDKQKEEDMFVDNKEDFLKKTLEKEQEENMDTEQSIKKESSEEEIEPSEK